MASFLRTLIPRSASWHVLIRSIFIMNMNLEMTRKQQQQPYGWLFESHDTSLACSPWLHSTLSELNEKTHTMLKMIEEDADTFADRVEMYYEKRPELISLVEDFYRAQRSLLEQIDRLRNHHRICNRRHCHMSTSLACSYKSCDDVDDDMLSDICHEDDEDRLGEEFASMQVKHEMMMEEIDKLKEEKMVKEKEIEELERRVVELMQEIERFRVENVGIKRISVERDEMEMKLGLENVALKSHVLMDEIRCDDMKKLREELGFVRLKNEEQSDLIKMKDEEKREVIRQLSLAIELLKDENVFLKKRFRGKRFF
ncbi:hypothetical protein V2J09_012386 [Rumex salicifolius]